MLGGEVAFPSFYWPFRLFFDSRVFELLDSRIEVDSDCCVLMSMQDNFVWGLIGIYGPSDDTL